MSDATPRGSFADEPGVTSRKLPWLRPIRSLPVGASSDRTAGVISVAMAPDVSTNGALPLCRAGASGYSSSEEPPMTVTSRPPRPTILEIDLDAAAGNVRAVRQLVGPERKIFAVIKADGYGHGAAEMGRVFVGNGADALGVADLSEGVRLRRRGLTCPILVYPNSLPEAAPVALAHRLVPTLVDLEGARAYAEAATGPCDVFVKIDVGLERPGVAAEAAGKGNTAMRGGGM